MFFELRKKKFDLAFMPTFLLYSHCSRDNYNFFYGSKAAEKLVEEIQVQIIANDVSFCFISGFYCLFGVIFVLKYH